ARPAGGGGAATGLGPRVPPRLRCSAPQCEGLAPEPFSPAVFQDPPRPAIYPLSLHDALPISRHVLFVNEPWASGTSVVVVNAGRSEEHTSELQSRENLVCRLLLEKKNGAEDTGPGR